MKPNTKRPKITDQTADELSELLDEFNDKVKKALGEECDIAVLVAGNSIGGVMTFSLLDRGELFSVIAKAFVSLQMMLEQEHGANTTNSMH